MFGNHVELKTHIEHTDHRDYQTTDFDESQQPGDLRQA
jgi:hypothetical protein